MRQIDFWFEFASTYSYPAAMRIEGLAAARNVKLRWRPFLLGPLFAEQGWRDSPFNIYPAKGRYMWRDLERICLRLGLSLRRPNSFPQNSLLAARVALALEPDLRPYFSRAVYLAEFAEGPPIDAPDAVVVFERSRSDANKRQLREETALALELGLPGAPCFVATDQEVFWAMTGSKRRWTGNSAALRWSRKRHERRPLATARPPLYKRRFEPPGQ